MPTLSAANRTRGRERPRRRVLSALASPSQADARSVECALGAERSVILLVEDSLMLPGSWPRLAAVTCGLIAALGLVCLSRSEVAADVADDEVELSLSSGGRSFTNGAGMKLVFVRRGAFQMGAPKDEK